MQFYTKIKDFVDHHKAFDTVELSAVWEAIKECWIGHEYFSIIQIIYENTTTTVNLNSPTIKINTERGVGQGGIMSPKLFITVLEHAFKTLEWDDQGVSIDEVNSTVLGLQTKLKIQKLHKANLDPRQLIDVNNAWVQLIES